MAGPRDPDASGVPDAADLAPWRRSRIGLRRIDSRVRQGGAVPVLFAGTLRPRENQHARAPRLHRDRAHCAGGAAAGAGPMAVKELPSGSTTLRSRPMGAPFFTGCRLTVTTSPTLNERRAQPRLVMSVGLLTSTAQFRTVPVSSIASNFRKQCGLAQIQSVTVPFSVKSLLVSKLAVPGCAATGAVIRTTTTKMNTAPEHLAFTEASLAIAIR